MQNYNCYYTVFSCRRVQTQLCKMQNYNCYYTVFSCRVQTQLCKITIVIILSSLVYYKHNYAKLQLLLYCLLLSCTNTTMQNYNCYYTVFSCLLQTQLCKITIVIILSSLVVYKHNYAKLQLLLYCLLLSITNTTMQNYNCYYTVFSCRVQTQLCKITIVIILSSLVVYKHNYAKLQLLLYCLLLSITNTTMQNYNCYYTVFSCRVQTQLCKITIVIILSSLVYYKHNYAKLQLLLYCLLLSCTNTTMQNYNCYYTVFSCRVQTQLCKITIVIILSSLVVYKHNYAKLQLLLYCLLLSCTNTTMQNYNCYYTVFSCRVQTQLCKITIVIILSSLVVYKHNYAKLQLLLYCLLLSITNTTMQNYNCYYTVFSCRVQTQLCKITIVIILSSLVYYKHNYAKLQLLLYCLLLSCTNTTMQNYNCYYTVFSCRVQTQLCKITIVIILSSLVVYKHNYAKLQLLLYCLLLSCTNTTMQNYNCYYTVFSCRVQTQLCKITIVIILSSLVVYKHNYAKLQLLLYCLLLSCTNTTMQNYNCYYTVFSCRVQTQLCKITIVIILSSLVVQNTNTTMQNYNCYYTVFSCRVQTQLCKITIVIILSSLVYYKHNYAKLQLLLYCLLLSCTNTTMQNYNCYYTVFSCRVQTQLCKITIVIILSSLVVYKHNYAKLQLLLYCLLLSCTNTTMQNYNCYYTVFSCRVQTQLCKITIVIILSSLVYYKHDYEKCILEKRTRLECMGLTLPQQLHLLIDNFNLDLIIAIIVSKIVYMIFL